MHGFAPPFPPKPAQTQKSADLSGAGFLRWDLGPSLRVVVRRAVCSANSAGSTSLGRWSTSGFAKRKAGKRLSRTDLSSPWCADQAMVAWIFHGNPAAMSALGRVSSLPIQPHRTVMPAPDPGVGFREL